MKTLLLSVTILFCTQLFAVKDIGISQIISPEEIFYVTEDASVVIRIVNYGDEDANDFNVFYQVEGGTPAGESLLTTLSAGDSIEFTFSATTDLSALGYYSICTWLSYAEDENLFNDTLCTVVNVIADIDVGVSAIIYPGDTVYTYELLVNANIEVVNYGYMTAVDIPVYYQVDGGLLITEFVEDTLEAGDTILFTFSTPYPFTEGLHEICCWTNMYSDLFNDNDSSCNFTYAIELPDIGVSAIVAPLSGTELTATETVTVEVTNYGWEDIDEFNIFYQVDGGTIFFDSYLGVEIEPGESTSLSLITVFDLSEPIDHYICAWTALADDTDLSNDSTCEWLYYSTFQDIGVSAILTPEVGSTLTDEEIVTVTVTHYGTADVTDFTAYYQVDGGVPITFTYMGDVISSSEAVDIEFAVPADMSGAGDHVICAWTFLVTDEVPSNDTTCSFYVFFTDPDVFDDGERTICEAEILDAGYPGATYLWSTGETTQTIIVTISGLYWVTLTDATGNTISDTLLVTVDVEPIADFTYMGIDSILYFENLSTSGAEYLWDFGDGITSTEEDPVHTYLALGTYTLTLIVSNTCGSASMTTIVIFIDDPSSTENIVKENINIYPNPASDEIEINLNGINDANGIIQFYSVHGDLLKEINIIDLREKITLKEFSLGMYYVVLQLENKLVFADKLLIIK
ncbi:MAG: PKD domain-containing protein [Fimbriimonadaceae bacterium]|nr:PKD domain-containing protein [Chitinophagales bacterium]